MITTAFQRCRATIDDFAAFDESAATDAGRNAVFYSTI